MNQAVKWVRPRRLPMTHIRWPNVVLLVVAGSSFMLALDATALNVALPSIGRDLSVGLDKLQWIAGAYTLIFASLLLTAGASSDRLGARNLFIAALLFFTAASVACGLSGNVGVLIAARAAQGLGAAAMLPSSMTLLASAYPEPAERSKAVAIWGGVSAIALVAGPITGGLLVEILGWRSIFFLNVPFCIAAVVGTYIAAPRSEPHRRRLDVGGQALATLTLVAATFVFIDGPVLGWASRPIAGAGIVAILSAFMFLMVEHRQADPMLPQELFMSRTFSASIGTAFLQTLAYYGTLFVLPVALQRAGAQPFAAGLTLAPMTVATGVLAIASGWICQRFGTRLSATAGLLLASVGAAVLTGFGLNTWSTAIGGVLVGVGGATLPIIVSVCLSSVPAAKMGVGSGALNTARQSGGAMGVAILGATLHGHAASPGLALSMIAVSFLAAAAVTFFGFHKE